ncbi:dipeptidase 1-like [Agrilus planipennis]|uniref:Dipeptidase n=1 Tax=Agrilus planipennis TaxID=224129 RepID=A0A1W4XTC1_AGRPL|nr:dipeptidase 1-like [Agrilus planipennis]
MAGQGPGSPPDPWALDPELRHHIQHCPCTCNHLGYGNYLDYQVSVPPVREPIRETAFSSVPHYYNGGGYNYGYHYHHGSPLGSCSCSTESDSTTSSLRSPWCVCLVVCVVVAALGIGLGLPLALNPQTEPHTPQDRLRIIRRLLKEKPLIDGHNDLPWNIRKFLHNRIVRTNFSVLTDLEPWSKSHWSQTDISRLREGLLGAQFWSAYVPCGSQHLDAVQLTLEQIDVIQRLVELHSRNFALVRSSSELLQVHRDGKIASLIGVEGGHSLGNSLAVLRMFYSLGARYLTITHSCDTPWATGANTKTKGGLNSFGRSVIHEMNRLGMIIDLSHSSMETARAALNVSRAPIIFSHSSAFSLCNSTRNVPDDVLKLVAHNGGVVMVNFYSYHLTCNGSATTKDVIRHINHIKTVAGIEHVGIGAGYDGINMTPIGLEDVSKYPYLLAELLEDPAWTENDIALLAGLNVLRVFTKVEALRDQWKSATIMPLEDSLPPQNPKCAYKFS